MRVGNQHVPFYVAGAYEMQAQILTMINSFNVEEVDTPDQVRRELYKRVSKFKIKTEYLD